MGVDVVVRGLDLGCEWWWIRVCAHLYIYVYAPDACASSTAASAFSEEGKPLTGAFSDTPEYYAALVRAFADAVVTRLK